jgi:TusA-related sulfurtransferase
VSLSGEEVVVHRVLNVTDYFNPIDCRSLGVIRTVLAEMERGEVLQVLGNRFQQREIAAWTKKFAHKIVKTEDDDGLVKIYIEKGGRS